MRKEYSGEYPEYPAEICYVINCNEETKLVDSVLTEFILQLNSVRSNRTSRRDVPAAASLFAYLGDRSASPISQEIFYSR